MTAEAAKIGMTGTGVESGRSLDAGPLPITAEDVDAAADLLRGVAVRTPLVENAELNERVGGRVLIKPETLQHTGSFKFRGAYNRVARLTAAERAKGVVAWSSGNHAQGVALAARLSGVKATILMPKDAPASKIEGTRRLGGEIVFYDRYTEDREAMGHAIAEESGALLVPSYDDPAIMAGQGTAALELLEDAVARGLALDAFAVCCGGGGLTAGSATWLAAHSPQTEIWPVEPEGFDDTARSLQAGARLTIDGNARSICDALLTPAPGRLTLPVLARHAAGAVTVSDAAVRAAMRFAFAHLKLVVEPGGAVALAALLEGRIDARGRTVGAVLSGGNVDPAPFAEILAEG